jgi:hypothetical protein
MSYAMEYIEQHGRSNVWCTPTQDTQYMIKPKRLTKPVGAVRKFSLLGQRYSLPTETGTYHVFMFGQVPASFFNIMDGQAIWRKASSICRQNNALIDIYLDNGVQFPRHDSWFLILPDKNIVIAVKDQPRIPFSLTTNAPAVRFYSNAFFNSVRRLEPVPSKVTPGTTFPMNWEIYVHGKTINTAQDISDMSTLFAEQYAKRGFAYGVVNGYKVSALNALTMAIGDVVEVVHDSTIAWVVDIPFNQLGSFHSLLDGKSKYLLTFLSGINALEKQVQPNPVYFDEASIFFKDDVDVFLYKPVSGTVNKGVIYHRNLTDSMRMVTHKDYSIPTGYLQSYIGSTGLFTNTDGLVIRLCLRKSGYDRSLINDTNRINELYKLADKDRQSDQTSSWFGPLQTLRSIMLGTESTVECWRAANLERSSYTKLMRSYDANVDKQMVIEAYGYHGVNRLLNPATTIATVPGPLNGPHVIEPPAGAYGAMTVYRYGVDINATDVNKAWYLGPQPANVNPNSKLTGPITVDHSDLSALNLRPGMVETLPSIASGFWGRTYNVPSETNRPYRGNGLRFYKAMQTVPGIQPTWIDVTDSSDYTLTLHRNPDNAANVYSYQWHVDLETWLVCVDDLGHHGYTTVDINHAAGDSQFSINESRRVPLSNMVILSTGQPLLPARNIEIFSHRRFMIEGLDYYLNETGTSAVICNVAAYQDPLATVDSVSINIRASGAIGPSFQRESSVEKGFVKNGIISADGRYDIRDSKPYRLYIDGRLINLDYLRDSTDSQLKEIIMEDPSPAFFLAPELSGLPYCFVDLDSPLPGLPSPMSSHAMREADIVKDNQISDYLTVRFPEPSLSTPQYAAVPYELFSPFMFKVLMAMKTDVLDVSDYSPLPTNGQLDTILASFLWLLDFDPCRKNNEWWKGYVVIKAHPFANRVEVTPAQRAFLLRINTFYLQGKIDVNSAIEII